MHAAPPPPEKTTLVSVSGEALKKIIQEKILHQKEPPPSPRLEDAVRLPLHPYQMIYTALGLAAFALGVTAWCRKEHIRLAGAATSLGLIAVCWEWVLIGVCIAVVIFILANIGS